MKNILFLVFFILTLSYSEGKDEAVKATSPSTPETTLPNNATAHEAQPLPGNSTGTKLANSTKLICYFDKLSVNRTDQLQYSLENLNSSLCTHVVYGFLALDPVTLKIKQDSLAPGYENVIALKEKGIVVMVSLGGLNDSVESEKYSKMVIDSNARKAFIDDTVHFLKEHKFQGLDLNWDYPLCWNGYCKAGRPADKANFQNLVRELHIAFSANKFLLSVAVSPLDSIADKAYDIPHLAKHADWINLMTFDYNNFTYTSTAIHSPFQGNSSSTVHTVEHWKSKGVPTSKLIIGIPTFGRTFTLAKELWNTTGSPATIGHPTHLNEPGLAAYFEICKDLNYQLVENVGPYAFAGDQWVSFDDLTSVKAKGEYAKKTGLGGALVYTLDMDDFSGNFCKQGTYPLINALRSAMSV